MQLTPSKSGLIPLPYQQDYLDQAYDAYLNHGLECSVNGSETGTGKTMMYVRLASMIAMHIERRTKERPTIWLFTVRQDKQQQVGEIIDWDLRNLSNSPADVYLVDGNEAERKQQIELAQWLKPRWVILNYEQGKNHLSQILEIFNRGIDLLICNEGDITQNVSSERSIATQSIATLASYRIVASATLIANRIDSLYPLLRIAQPREVQTKVVTLVGKEVTCPMPTEAAGVGRRKDFLNDFAFMENERVVGVRNVPKLQKILTEQYGLFIATKEMAGIERSDNIPLYVDLSDESRKLYNGIKNGILKYADELEAVWDYMSAADKTEEIRHILVQLNLARRAASLSPANFSRLRLQRKLLALGEEMGEKFEMPPIDVKALAKHNAKVDAVMEKVNEFMASGKKDGGIYIHSEWTDVLDEVEWALKKAGIAQQLNLMRIDGDTTSGLENIRTAVKYGTCRLVLASNSGGRGLNLQKLNITILIVPPWSPWIIQQAAGRTERLGQANETKIYYVLASDTIDVKKMWMTVTSKEKDNQQVLHGQKGKHYKSILDISSPKDIREWL